MSTCVPGSARDVCLLFLGFSRRAFVQLVYDRARTLGSLVFLRGRRCLLRKAVWTPSGTLLVAISMKVISRAAQHGDTRLGHEVHKKPTYCSCSVGTNDARLIAHFSRGPGRINHPAEKRGRAFLASDGNR